MQQFWPRYLRYALGHMACGGSSRAFRQARERQQQKRPSGLLSQATSDSRHGYPVLRPAQTAGKSQPRTHERKSLLVDSVWVKRRVIHSPAADIRRSLRREGMQTTAGGMGDCDARPTKCVESAVRKYSTLQKCNQASGSSLHRLRFGAWRWQRQRPQAPHLDIPGCQRNLSVHSNPRQLSHVSKRSQRVSRADGSGAHDSQGCHHPRRHKCSPCTCWHAVLHTAASRRHSDRKNF